MAAASVDARPWARRLSVILAGLALLCGSRSDAKPSSSPAARPAPTPKGASRPRSREQLSSFYRGGARPEPRPSPREAPARPGLFAGRNAKVTSLRSPVTAAYRESARHWHETSGHAAPLSDRGEACLLLVNINARERATLCPLEGGGFTEADRESAARLFREPGSENAHPVSARLLDVLLAIQEHFHAGEIRLLSGYRSPWEGNSNHGKGRAADIIVPGTSDEAAASFARTLGFVGVGIYPTSHFIHVDVREASYFWVDASAPGRPHRERGILAPLAKESDEKARARRERPTFGPLVRRDVAAWLSSRGAASTAPIAEDDAAGDERNSAAADADGLPSPLVDDADGDEGGEVLAPR